MADAVTKSQLEGYFKEVYGAELYNAIPDIGILQQMVPFRESEMLGNAFHIPVIVGNEQGVTYGGPTEDNFALNAPVAFETKDASVQGAQIVIRSAIGYKAAASAVAKGPKAFGNATKETIRRLMNSAARRVESMHLYGQSGIGIGDSSANESTTATVVTFTQPSWAPGMWVGQKGAIIQFYNLADTLVATVTISKVVSLRLRTLRVTGTTGEIAALDVALAAGDCTAFWFGAHGKEALGLDKIITTSGTLFGIDNTTHDLFKGQQYAVGGALTFDKLTDAITDQFNYGLDEDVCALVSGRTWQDLNASEAALRQYDYSYKKAMAEKGNKGINYQIMNINCEILAHPMVKEGEGFVFPKSALMRVGAYDLSLKNPGMGEDMFRELSDSTGFELRAYTDQALFSVKVAILLKLTGIVNS